MIVLPRKEINPVSFNTNNIIHVSLGNLERVPVLIDTGSQINFLPLPILSDVDPSVVTECEMMGPITLRAACGNTTTVTYHVQVPVTINEHSYNVNFYAAPYINQVTLGSPFCSEYNVVIDFSDNSMCLLGEYKFQINTLDLDVDLPAGVEQLLKVFYHFLRVIICPC